MLNESLEMCFFPLNSRGLIGSGKYVVGGGEQSPFEKAKVRQEITPVEGREKRSLSRRWLWS